MGCSDMARVFRGHFKGYFSRTPSNTADSKIQVEESAEAVPHEKATTGTSTTAVESSAFLEYPQTQAKDSTLRESLWNQAYDALKTSDHKLVQSYERILSRQLKEDIPGGAITDNEENSIAQANPTERQYQMRQLVERGLQKTQRRAQLKMDIGNRLRIVNGLKDVVSLAVRNVPEAALPWAAICLGLQMVSNPIEGVKANRSGLDYVITRMDWYCNLSGRFSKNKTEEVDSTAGLQHELETRLVELYKVLLSYQMKSVCLYYQRTGLAFFRDLVKLDDWTGSLNDIQSAETVFRDDWQVYRNEQQTTSLEGINDSARNIFQAVENQPTRQRELWKEEEDRKCLRDLRLIDPRDDMKKLEQRKDSLLRDSYQWILDRKEFKDFTTGDDQNTHRLFWISGDAGKGKTMLLIGIIRELSRQLSEIPDDSFDPVCLSYFFCQGTNSDLNTATAALRCMVWMVLDQQPWLASHLRKKYDGAGSKLFTDENTFNALSEIVKNMVKDERFQRTYFMVDALDECDDSKRPGLTELLALICETASPKVKWLVTSRNREDIKARLTKETYARLDLELNADSITDAVATYIDHKLLELSMTQQFDDNIREKVATELRKKADGTFLWVALVCKILGSVDGNDAIDVLDDIPSSLEEVYGQMMDQINRLSWKDPNRCKQVLSIATLAYRPLNLNEMAVLSDMQPDRLQRILTKCASFLTVRDNIVYFIHQSAKEYLHVHCEEDIFPKGRGAVHCELVNRSITEMSSVLQKDIYHLGDSGVSIGTVDLPTLDPLSSLQYSCAYWVQHICEIDASFHHQIGLHDHGQVHHFFNSKLLHWLEALSLIRSVSVVVTAMRELEKTMTGSGREQMELRAMIQDATRFILYNRVVLEEAPLQVYCSALIFSPLRSKVRQLYQSHIPSWITVQPHVTEKWSSCLQTLESHTDIINSVAFSPDGRTIASGSGLHDRTVRIWDAETGIEQRILHASTGSVLCVKFSPDGRYLAAGLSDGTVRLWDREGVEQRIVKGHTKGVKSVVFSPDGRQLATGSRDKTVRLWDIDGVERRRFCGHSGAVTQVVFLPNSRRISSASTDCTVRLWDLDSGLEQSLLQHTGAVFSIDCSPNGRWLVSGCEDDAVRLWDLETGTQARIFKGSTHPEVSNKDIPTIELANENPAGDAIAEPNAAKPHVHTVEAVAFSLDGRWVASGSCDRAVRLWDAVTGHELQVFRGHSIAVCSLAFSPTGRHLASGGEDETVRLWEIGAEAQPEPTTGHLGPINSVAISPDGGQLATASEDFTIRLWDPQARFEQHSLRGHGDSVTAVTFSPDGQYLASGSDDHAVCVWDTASRKKIHTLQGHSDGLTHLAFSPDSSRLASASHDQTICIWDTMTWQRQGILKGHTAMLCSVAFSPDSHRLASAAGDNKIVIWDIDTETQLHVLQGHSMAVTSVAFSQTGERLASISMDLTMRLWDIERGELLETFELDKAYKLSYTYEEPDLRAALNSLLLEYSVSFGATTLWACYQELKASWVLLNGKRVLWLPPEYRPLCSWVRDGYIGIGSQSGHLFTIRFDHALSPFSL